MLLPVVVAVTVVTSARAAVVVLVAVVAAVLVPVAITVKGVRCMCRTSSFISLCVLRTSGG